MLAIGVVVEISALGFGDTELIHPTILPDGQAKQHHNIESTTTDEWERVPAGGTGLRHLVAGGRLPGVFALCSEAFALASPLGQGMTPKLGGHAGKLTLWDVNRAKPRDGCAIDRHGQIETASQGQDEPQPEDWCVVYDSNENGRIDKAEFTQAKADWQAGEISEAAFLEVQDCWQRQKEAEPRLDSLEPNEGAPGDRLSVTARGSNVPTELSGANLDFGPNIRVSNFVRISASKLSFDLAIDAQAATGDRQVTLTTPQGDASATFTVRSQGRNGNDTPPEVPPDVLGAIRLDVPKLSGSLQQVVLQVKRNSLEAAKAYAESQGFELVGDSIRVLLRGASGTGSTLDEAAIQELGGSVEQRSASYGQALLPIDKLEAAARKLDGLAWMDRPAEPTVADESVSAQNVSRGVRLTGAERAHSRGIRGGNATVAIIDLGFSGLQAALNAGEIDPSVVNADCTRNYVNQRSGLSAVDARNKLIGPPRSVPPRRGPPRINSNIRLGHGIHVAHIVHNMAPKAELCLKLIDNQVQLQRAVNDAINEGVNVINHSVGWNNVGGFYDGTSNIDSIVSTAADNGILWVNSAGNDAQRHWQGAFQDPNGNRRLNFTPNDECNNVSARTSSQNPSKGRIAVFLNWDAYPTEPIDYDLFMFRKTTNGSKLVAASRGTQRGTQPPEETLILPNAEVNATYCFAIRLESKPSDQPSPDLEVFLRGTTTPQHNVARSSLIEPANGADTLAVAAINHATWQKGPKEPFSSQGSSNSSQRASSRTKPDIAGPDRTTTIGGDSFPGTSAAAPHVSGCAALLFDDRILSTPTARQVKSKLASAAIDMGPSGKDTAFGAGRLSCDFQATSRSDGPKKPRLSQYDKNDNCQLDDSEFFTLVDDWINQTVDNSLFFDGVDAWINETDICQSGSSGQGLTLATVGTQSLTSNDALTFQAIGHNIDAIRVDVYALSGQQVFTREATGSTLRWNLATSKGRPVANGTYLYRVAVHGPNGQVQRSKIKKLIVLR